MDEVGEVLCTLGKGRYSKVYCVREKITHEIVAIKLYDRARLQFRSKEILKEKEVLLRIQGHTLLSHLLRTHKDDDSLYFFLSPLLAGSLHQQMLHTEGGVLPAATCRLYASEIVAALFFLATRGVMHRDVKANNVMLNDIGHLVLCDFGSAATVFDPSCFQRVIGAGGTEPERVLERRCFTVCGTEAYMAPEMRVLLVEKRRYERQVQESLERRQQQGGRGFSMEALSRQLEAEPTPPVPVGPGYNLLIDWYAAGILMYEMKCGVIISTGQTGGASDEKLEDSSLLIVFAGDEVRRRLELELESDTSEASPYSAAFADLILSLTEERVDVRAGVYCPYGVLNHPYFGPIEPCVEGSFGRIGWHGLAPAEVLQVTAGSDAFLVPPQAQACAAGVQIDFDRSLGWFDIIDAEDPGESVDQSMFSDF